MMALLIGIPLGIWFALSRWAWKVFSPVLDMMQTLPSFVYLIPALPFFALTRLYASNTTRLSIVKGLVSIIALLPSPVGGSTES